MKRDMELVRAILLAVNERTDLKPEPIELQGYEKPVVQRHVAMLFDAGYLEGIEHRSGRSMDREIHVTDMSWEGHDFLAATQNSKVWQKMKVKLSSEMIDVPINLVKELGSALLKQQMKSLFGLPDL